MNTRVNIQFRPQTSYAWLIHLDSSYSDTNDSAFLVSSKKQIGDQWLLYFQNWRKLCMLGETSYLMYLSLTNALNYWKLSKRSFGCDIWSNIYIVLFFPHDQLFVTFFLRKFCTIGSLIPTMYHFNWSYWKNFFAISSRMVYSSFIIFYNSSEITVSGNLVLNLITYKKKTHLLVLWLECFCKESGLLFKFLPHLVIWYYIHIPSYMHMHIYIYTYRYYLYLKLRKSPSSS